MYCKPRAIYVYQSKDHSLSSIHWIHKQTNQMESLSMLDRTIELIDSLLPECRLPRWLFHQFESLNQPSPVILLPCKYPFLSNRPKSFDYLLFSPWPNRLILILHVKKNIANIKFKFILIHYNVFNKIIDCSIWPVGGASFRTISEYLGCIAISLCCKIVCSSTKPWSLV